MEDVETRRSDRQRRPANAPPLDPRDEIRALLELATLDSDISRRQAALNQTMSALETVRCDLARLSTALRADRGDLARHDESGGFAADWERLRHSIEEKEHRSAILAREVEKKQAESLATSADLRDRRAELPARRKALICRISAATLDAYDVALRSGRQPAVLGTLGIVCWGCHLRLPAAAAMEFRTSKHAMPCPHCLRLLYNPNWLERE